MPPSAVWLAALPSISTRRPAPSLQVAASWRAVGRRDAGRHLPADRLGAAGELVAGAPRRPRPGERSETASIRLVLPAPFGPKTATGRPSNSSRAPRCERKCERASRVTASRSDPHRHHDVDRGLVVALAHQRRIAGRVEEEDRVLAVDLVGDLLQVLGVEADLQPLVAVGDGELLVGGARSRAR